jgi:hypothetical protein
MKKDFFDMSNLSLLDEIITSFVYNVLSGFFVFLNVYIKSGFLIYNFHMW